MNDKLKIVNWVKKIEEYRELEDGKGFLKFFEEQCKIFHPARGIISPTVPQIFRDIVKAFFNDHFVIILKSRQVGVSTLFANLGLYACIFFPGTAVGVISRRKDDAISFLERAKNSRAHLPVVFKTALISDNKLSLHFASGSKFLTSAPTKDAFRGETLSILIIDEAGACSNIERLYSSAYLTLSQNFDKLRTRKAPYGIVIISTGGFLTEPSVKWFNRMWNEARDGANPYKAFKVHWKDVNLPEEWYEKQKAALNHNPDLITTELDCGFIIRDSDSAIFNQDILNKIKENVEKIHIVDWEFYKKYFFNKQ